MVYYNPYMTGYYNPLYNLTNQGFFHCSCDNTFGLRIFWRSTRHKKHDLVQGSLYVPWSRLSRFIGDGRPPHLLIGILIMGI